MSNFELSDLGEGRFDLSGDMSFQTAEAILRESEKRFASHEVIEVNMSAVQHTDSAGLALLLEWVSQAAQQSREIRFAQIPEKIQAIAVTARSMSYCSAAILLQILLQILPRPRRSRSHRPPAGPRREY